MLGCLQRRFSDNFAAKKLPTMFVKWVVLLESSRWFGGWLWSTRRPDGAVIEHEARGIRPAGAVGRNMVEELGLTDEILPVTYAHGPVRQQPAAQDAFRAQLADIAIDSLCHGVFAGGCRKLSIRSCFPILYNAEQRRDSIILGMLLGSGPGPGPEVCPGCLAQQSVSESWAQWSLIRGIQSLPESLADFLQRSGKVHLPQDATVRQATPSESGWKIHLEDGVVNS